MNKEGLEQMNVEIIAVGNEVVSGYTINTNASYLAQEVQKIGMKPTYISAVCDDSEAISRTLQQAMERSEVILLTGGLGPTPDDLTKETVCQTLGMPVKIIPEELEIIKAKFVKLGKEMSDNNVKQAAFPQEAVILPNDCGTAPGCMIEVNHTIIVLLPGPPKEMKQMFECYVMPVLKKKATLHYAHLDIKCFGIGEGEVAARIEPFLGVHGQMNVATYINAGEVIVRLTAYGASEQEAKSAIDEMKTKVEACLEAFIFGYNEERLEEKIVNLLLEKQYTISTVESCTGGLIAATLINCSGVSTCLKESVVTYSNEAKMAYVNVKKETLDRVGAVSEETAREMAEGIKHRANADIGLSSTGIAGPGGGTPLKPVGLVYIGIAMKGQTEVFKLQLNGTRQEIRERTVKNILFQLYKKLK